MDIDVLIGLIAFILAAIGVAASIFAVMAIENKAVRYAVGGAGFLLTVLFSIVGLFLFLNLDFNDNEKNTSPAAVAFVTATLNSSTPTNTPSPPEKDPIDTLIPPKTNTPEPIITPTPSLEPTITPTSSFTPTPTKTNTPEPIITPTSSFTPIPTKTNTPIPIILFSDDFTNRAKPEWDSVSGSWLTTNDEYSMTDIGEDWTSGLSLIGDNSWSDYRVTVKINLKNTHRNNDAYVLVRVHDADNFLALRFKGGPKANKNDASWFKVIDGEWSELSNTKFTDYPNDEYFTVEIEAMGDTITTYINRKKIKNNWSNAPYLNGGAGILISSRDTTDVVSFDDFVVEAITPP